MATPAGLFLLVALHSLHVTNLHDYLPKPSDDAEAGGFRA